VRLDLKTGYERVDLPDLSGLLKAYLGEPPGRRRK
jgi:hypothetical protein